MNRDNSGVMFPRYEPYKLGSRVKLTLHKDVWTGTSLRTYLLKMCIQDQYDKYKITKLTPRTKILAMINMQIIEKCKYAIITGIRAKGTHYHDFSPSNVCYTDGTHSRLEYYTYDLFIHGIVDIDGRMCDNQFRIPDTWACFDPVK
jgi:hypothetical protein